MAQIGSFVDGEGDPVHGAAPDERFAMAAPMSPAADKPADSPRDVVIVTGSVPTMDRVRRAAISFTPDVHVLAIRAELLAEPKMQRIDPLTIATIGALGDLPQLMIRGGL